jgi:hypothetical protein
MKLTAFVTESRCSLCESPPGQVVRSFICPTGQIGECHLPYAASREFDDAAGEVEQVSPVRDLRGNRVYED